MSVGLGLVVRADGSGCRLVEYDGSGAVVGPSEGIRLSENNINNIFTSPMATATRRQTAQVDEPAIWSHPRVRAAGITLADVLAGSAADARSAPAAPTADPIDDDPQAAFVRLAERVCSYRLAAREHPEMWAAAREVANLNGRQEART